MGGIRVISDNLTGFQGQGWDLAELSPGESTAGDAVASMEWDVLVVCNHAQGARISIEEVVKFVKSADDVWHAGPALSSIDDETFLVYIEPLLNYRSTPDSTLDRAINWKISPACYMIKLDRVRRLRYVRDRYATPAMEMADLGFFVLRRGGIVRQVPALAAKSASSTPQVVSPVDRYHFVRKYYGTRSAQYLLLRSVLSLRNPVRNFIAYKASANVTPFKFEQIPKPHWFDDLALPEGIHVNAVLPTFGRYPYLAEVLEDIRHQSIPPKKIWIADGNPQTPENEKFYHAFADLPIEVLWMDKEGTCYTRNQCLERATGNFIWIVDDDSRIAPDNLENHLRLLIGLRVDASVGPAYTKGRPDLVDSQKNIVSTFFDCGTSLCTTDILRKTGGFDMQYNNYLANEDGELGIRILKAGGVILNNPFAKRFHYLAPIGGARSSPNNLHRWKRWSLRPRPVQSIYYTGRRHFSKKAAREATLKSWLLESRKKKPASGKFWWEVKYVMSELAALPISLLRLWISVRIGRAMIKEGPQIPLFKFEERL